MARHDDEVPRLLRARGPRAAEKLLVARLRRLMPEGRSADLARPVLLLVPSGTMRRQLLGRLTRSLGPALLGLDILSLRTLAGRLLERARHPARPGSEFFELLVRREAAKDPVLARDLDLFEDGYGLCVGSVRDLASAGALEADAGALDECLAELPTGPEQERARALIATTERAVAAMRALDLERGGDLMRRAAETLAAAPLAVDRGGDLLPASAILIHGFADAPGQTREFLRALLARPGAQLILDLPPEPSRPGEEAAAAIFARRFAESLGLEVGEEIDEVALPAPWQAFDAVGREAEVRECVWRIEAEIAGGTAPERIGIVTRDFAGYAPELRRQFEELGIPLSGPALDRGLHPRAEEAQALAALVDRGGELDLDRFMILTGASFLADGGAGRRRDLLLGLRKLGLTDLDDLATLEVDRQLEHDGRIELPVGLGFSDDEDGRTRNRKKRLEGAHLVRAVTRAGELLARLADVPKSTTLARRAAALAAAARDLLGHDEGKAPGWLLVLDKLSLSEAQLELTAAEFRRLYEAALDEEFPVPLGGQGLGVQVLALAQARGLAFEKLHVLGLNAKVFPAGGREDPLLGDAVRESLRQVLPGLGLHRDRPDEEAYLFAQLMAAAGNVSLSWMRADDGGKELARSSFVERLALAAADHEKKRDDEEDQKQRVSMPRILEERLGRARERGASLSARDRQLLAALEHRESERLALRALELREHVTELPAALGRGTPQPEIVAQAQVDIVAEIEALPQDPRRARLSPWMGRVGADPLLTEGPLWITTLEGMGRCPWQTFIRRALRIEVLPDPTRVLPDIDGLLLGDTVHAALEMLLGPEGPESRPDSADLDMALPRAARQMARDHGIELEGLLSVLAKRARPMVERALDLDWQGEEGPDIEAVELNLEVTIATARGGHRPVGCRADRVDRVDQSGTERGRRATDYKTGSPTSDAKKAATRRDKVLAAILEGNLLQGAAYALAVGRGRYLHLNPDLGDELAVVELTDDDETHRRFAIVTAILEGAWAAGLVPPRVENAKGKQPLTCDYCDLQTACLQGDSGARRRLVDLAAAEAVRGGPSLLADLWDPGGRGAALLGDEQ